MPKVTGVSIESQTFSVFAGETVQTKAVIHNSGNTAAQFTFRIEGLDPDWYNLPVASTTLFPNDEEKLLITFHPPGTDKAKAGLYPFCFIIDCPENPDDTELVELTLEVKEHPELKLYISPERISGKKGEYTITAYNPSDEPFNITLSIADQDRLIKCQLEPAILTIPANESKSSTLRVKRKWLHFIHRRKAYHFTVAARQADSDLIRTVSGQLFKATGQIQSEPRPSLSPRIRGRRQPPDIGNFEVTTEDKRLFTLTWKVENASEIKLNDETVEPEGSKELRPTDPASYILTAENKHGSTSRTVNIEPLSIPEAKYSDRILAIMTPNALQISAGSEAIEATIEIQNVGTIVDKFLFEIEGLAPAWYSLSTSSVALMPHAKEQVQIFLHPPKTKGVTAENYIFALTLRSQSIPEDSTTIIAQLEILPSVDFGIALKPYRIHCRRKSTLNVQITNKDVSEAALFIDVTDIENGLRFNLENDSPVIPPWQTVVIPMLVKPKRNSIVGDIKRYDISLNATTADGYTQLARGQLDHKPLLSSWRPVFRTVKYLVIFGAIGFFIYYIIRLGGGWSSLVRDPQTWLDGTIRHMRGWFY